MNYKKISTFFLAVAFLIQLSSVDVRIDLPNINIGETEFKVKQVELSRETKTLPASFASASRLTNAVLFVGDVLLARNVEYLMEKNGHQYPFSGLNFNDIAVHPFVFGNFEASVPKVHIPTEALKIKFSVNKIYLEAAKNAGFTHYSLANNHSFDFKKDGFLNTKNELDLAGFEAFGDPNSLSHESVTFLDLKDMHISVIGIHTLEKTPTNEELNSLVGYASSKSDIQVAYVHWGLEYESTSHVSQQTLAKKLVAAGIDLIIGHHPHVVQEVGLIDGVPVFYSLGNYIFDQYASSEMQNGLMLDIEFSDEPKIYLVPVTSQYNLSQPTYMNKKQAKKFLTGLAQRSDPELGKYLENGLIPLNIIVATSSKVAMINK